MNQQTQTSDSEYPIFNTLSHKLPQNVRTWLASKNITPDIRKDMMYWDEQQEELVFPVYNQDNQIVFSNNRYFGEDKKRPRYINKGSYKENLLLLGNPTDSVVFIVEDYISALRIAATPNSEYHDRGYAVYPIFGCDPQHEHMLELANQFLGAIFFLDPDKKREAFQLKIKYKHIFEYTDSVYNSKDPKDYDEDDLKRILQIHHRNAEHELFSNKNSIDLKPQNPYNINGDDDNNNFPPF